MSTNADNWLDALFDFEQPQLEALVDLLIWSMYVDDEVADHEEGHLWEVLWELPWDSDESLEHCHRESVLRATHAHSDAEAGGYYLDKIATRLASPEARQVALVACRAMAAADGVLAPEEEAFLTRVEARFAQ